ncbi:response regulator [Rhizobium sp. SIMBA_035]
MNVIFVKDEIIVALNLEDQVHYAGHRFVGVAVSCDDALPPAPKANAVFVVVRPRDDVEGPNIARRLIGEFDVDVVFLTGNPETVVGFRGPLPAIAKPVRNGDVAATLRCISVKTVGEDTPTPQRLTMAA